MFVYRKSIIEFEYLGDVVCSKCQYIFSFSAIEKFYTGDKQKRKSADIQRDRDLFLKSKPKPTSLTTLAINKDAVPINAVEATELEEVFSHLGLENITAAAFHETGILCNAKRKVLYFPMQNTDSTITGYKKLSRIIHGQIMETTIPDANSFGAVILPPVQRRGKDQKTAILVLNVLDALALRMQKHNGTKSFYFFLLHFLLNVFIHSYDRLPAAWFQNTTARMSSGAGIVSKASFMV